MREVSSSTGTPTDPREGSEENPTWKSSPRVNTSKSFSDLMSTPTPQPSPESQSKTSTTGAESNSPGSINSLRTPITQPLHNTLDQTRSPVDEDIKLELRNATLIFRDFSPSQPGAFQLIQSLGIRCSLITTSNLQVTVHNKDHNEWKVPSIKSQIIIFGGINIGAATKRQTKLASVECHSFPGAGVSYNHFAGQYY